MKRNLPLLLLSLVTAACGGVEETKDPVIRVSATAVPESEIAGYGSVVHFRFAFRNDGAFPLFIDRIEALGGYRHTLAELARPRPGDGSTRWIHSGLLLPGQHIQIVTPYRVTVVEERILLTVRPSTREEILERVSFPLAAGAQPATEALVEEFSRVPPEVPLTPDIVSPRTVHFDPPTSRSKLPEAIAVVSVPCPEMPFDPWSKGAAGRAWTYSRALGGFVFRPVGGDIQLFTEQGMVPMPHVSFTFLRDVDLLPEGVVVLTRSGDRRTVTGEGLLEFLGELRAERLGIEGRGSPDRPGQVVYGVTRW